MFFNYYFLIYSLITFLRVRSRLLLLFFFFFYNKIKFRFVCFFSRGRRDGLWIALTRLPKRRSIFLPLISVKFEWQRKFFLPFHHTAVLPRFLKLVFAGSSNKLCASIAGLGSICSTHPFLLENLSRKSSGEEDLWACGG